MITFGELKKLAAAYEDSNTTPNMFSSRPLLDIFNRQVRSFDESSELTERELFTFFQNIMFILQVNKSDEKSYKSTCTFINGLYGPARDGEDDDRLRALQMLNKSRNISFERFFQILSHPSSLALANACSELSDMRSNKHIIMHEWEYNALCTSVDPMVSAKALISLYQHGNIPSVETSIKVILHKNPAEMAKALIIFSDGTIKQSKYVDHQVKALCKHLNPVKLAQTYYKFIREKITLTPAQELKIAELENPESVIQPLIDLTTILSHFPSNISAEIKDAIIVHQLPTELAEAIKLIHDNTVDIDDTQRFLLLKSDDPKTLAASYATLKLIPLDEDDFSNVVSHPESIELISKLYAINHAGVHLVSPDLKKIIAHEYFKEVSEAIIHLKTHAPDLMLDSKNIQTIIDHQRPKYVLATLKSLEKINKKIDQSELNKIKTDGFANWRSDITPSVEMRRPVVPDEWTHDPLKREVVRQAQEEYKKSIHLMEHSVAEISLGYVRKLDRIPDPFPKGKLANAEAGPLLQFASVYSARYLDLYKAYVSIEKKKGIPMIPVSAGQLKLHGFTSEDILQMQPECKIFTNLVTTLRTTLQKEGSKAYGKVVCIMVGKDKLTRKEAIELSKEEFEASTEVRLSDEQHQDIIAAFKTYDQLPDKGTSLIRKAHFLMHDFGHLSYENIANQLTYVGDIEPQHLENTTANPDERLLMEIRHRVAGDSTIQQNSSGTLGGNPLTYLNVVTKGEPENLEAEFRNKMYFVYMSNHFANAVIHNDEMVGEINQWLRENGKDWELDMDFITTMRQRGAQYMPPIFRYGANAVLNREFREIKSDEAVSEFYSTHPNISLREAMEGSAHHNVFHQGKLSSREYLNQMGELEYSPNDPRNERQLNFGTGGAIFELKTSADSNMSQATKVYLDSVNELGIPVCAGISGTLDQSTAMAGLVGLGVNEELSLRQFELETIRLAYLGFMVPGGDHTVHEIMQSSKTYGLPYVGGLGYEAYIYPMDDGYIKERLRHLQQMRGSDLPEYFFSEEHLNNLLQDLEQRVSLSQVELKKFHERLDAAKFNTLHPELLKKLSNDEYQKILTFFSEDTNTLLWNKLSLLENGQSCRFAKEDTGLPRTINILRSQDGKYKLFVETKPKLAEGIKDLATPVFSGFYKKGKPSWRLDIQEEYFGATASMDSDDPKHKAYIDEIKAESDLSRLFSQTSSAICVTDVGMEFDKNGKKKISLYSPKAIGTLNVVLESLAGNAVAKNKLISDLLLAVKAMHDLGYVHQDLKPKNILVYEDGHGGYTLKLTDFGETKKHGDNSKFGSGAYQYQSPELAYYYTNPAYKEIANRDYGQQFYSKDLLLMGRLAMESPQGEQIYPQTVHDREAYKAPSTSNDMWAVGMLVYYIQHGMLPETVSDIQPAKIDPLVKGLLAFSRGERIDIDRAIKINQDIISSPEGRLYMKKQESHRYYIGINLKTSLMSGSVSNSREKLGDDIAHYLQGPPNKD